MLDEKYKVDHASHAEYHHVDAAEFLVAKARKDMERMIKSSTRNDPKEVYDTVKVRNKIRRSEVLWEELKSYGNYLS